MFQALCTYIDLCLCRKVVEDAEIEAVKKKQKHNASCTSLESQKDNLLSQKDSCEEKLAMWNRVLTMIVSSETHHGTKKAPDVSWQDYFEEGLGKKIDEVPMTFQLKQLKFEDAVVALSTHIALLRKELEKVEKQVKTLSDRLDKKQQAVKRRDEKVKKKAEKVVKAVNEGNELGTTQKQKKRRRQLYHAKKLWRGKTTVCRRPRHRTKTKDPNGFSSPLQEPRKVITLDQKLQAVAYFKQLKAEKAAAKESLLEPRPATMTRAELKARKEKREKLRGVARRNIQAAVRDKFKQFLSQGSQVLKWERVAEKEAWEEIPAMVRSRLTCTTNSWREKLGLPRKGKPLGGKIPITLQKELDMLMMEMSMGSSSVSVRKEMVTAEAVVS